MWVYRRDRVQGRHFPANSICWSNRAIWKYLFDHKIDVSVIFLSFCRSISHTLLNLLKHFFPGYKGIQYGCRVMKIGIFSSHSFCHEIESNSIGWVQISDQLVTIKEPANNHFIFESTSIPFQFLDEGLSQVLLTGTMIHYVRVK